MTREYRRYDGHGNNLDHPEWGAAGQPLLRNTPVHYADRISEPARHGGGSPNPRAISNAVHQAPAGGIPPNPQGVSDYLWAWGQFLDHEIDLTEPKEEAIAIEVPPDDPVFAEGSQIAARRSLFQEGSGGGTGNPRQQINEISAFIDGTNVYGPSEERNRALRRLDGSGKLELVPSDHGDLLPKNIFGLDNAAPSGAGAQQFFLAGDVRANEHAVLTCMHTLWAREHNRVCDELLAAFPSLAGDDEQTFQRARQIVIGKMQAITYREFLPALLGDGAINLQRKYDSGENAGVDNLFSTAAYRLGHSMVSSELLLGDGSTMALRDAFFDPSVVESLGIETFLAGLAQRRMQSLDRFAVEDLRSFLFANVMADRPQDLAALNILRGRDHGLPDYNTCRRSLGLTPRASFAEVSSDTDTQDALASVYGSVEEIDPWTGGLCEDPQGPGLVGEFFTAVLVDQFARFRSGDRFFYEWNPNLTHDERLVIHKTRLSTVIERNTSLKVPKNVFFVAAGAVAVP